MPKNVASKTNSAIAKSIAEINQRLKQASIRVQVWLNGKSLVLRATLPKKPGQGEGRKQQDISLGIPANKDGLKRIEIEAQKLGGLMTMNAFSWDLYIPDEKRSDRISVARLIENFKADYTKSQPLKVSTWKSWLATLRKLPQNEPLSESAVVAVLLSTKPNSASRQLATYRLQAICDYAGLPLDLKTYKGSYGRSSEKPRNIPTDEMIVEWRDRIPNERWRWVYGMMATFGLRPHEVFHCEFIDAHTVDVLKGKTGYHRARAILPEWAEQWNLIDKKLPAIEPGRDFKVYGDRNKRQFQRYGIPFPAYNLRHAYAIRGSVAKGLPTSTMAQMMGHSVAVHTREYHHWLSDVTNEAVYRKLILNE